jgi:hypothetical protein
MNDAVTAAIARHDEQAQDRRASLKVLGLAALLTGALPRVAAAKGGKQPKDRCKTQVGPCKKRLGLLCGGMGADQCLANVATCCGFLRDCDAAEAVDCIIDRFIV